MRKFILTLSLLFVFSFLFSQNYKTIHASRKAIFKNNNAMYPGYYSFGALCYNSNAISYYGLEIDSVKIMNADTMYYNFNVIRRDPDYSTSNCEFKDFPNWTGSKIVEKSNGENVFFNKEGDSIRIRTKAKVNDKWHLFDFSNGDYYEAEVTSKFQGSVLTMTDSIKVITIFLKDNSGNDVANNFNGKEIILSKNFGVMKVYDFSSFPSDTSSFTLEGISNPLVGKQNITARQIFDYNVGDEFHIEDALSYVPDYGIFKKIKRVIYTKQVSANEDTIDYRVARVVFTKNYDYQNGTSDSSFVKDTISEKIIVSQYGELNTIPSRAFIDDGSYYHDNCIQSSNYNQRLLKITDHMFLKNTDCFNEVILVGDEVEDFYIDGLGYYYEGDEPPSQNHKRLVYYKKGSDTWGTPIDFDLLSSLHSLAKFKVPASVSPNPFSDFTVLKISNSNKLLYELVISDIYGKVIQEYSFNEGQLIIQNDGSMKGMYIYKLFQDGNEKGSGKIVIY